MIRAARKRRFQSGSRVKLRGRASSVSVTQPILGRADRSGLAQHALEPLDKRALVLGRDIFDPPRATERRLVSGAGDANDRHVTIASFLSCTAPGRDARVDRRPLVILAVEQQSRNADAG